MAVASVNLAERVALAGAVSSADGEGESGTASTATCSAGTAWASSPSASSAALGSVGSPRGAVSTTGAFNSALFTGAALERRERSQPSRFFGAASSSAEADEVAGITVGVALAPFAGAGTSGEASSELACEAAMPGAVFPAGLGSISGRRDENHPRRFFGAAFSVEAAAGDAVTGGTDGDPSPREPALVETALGVILPAGFGSISGRRDENHPRRLFGAVFASEAAGDAVTGGAFAAATDGDPSPREPALAKAALDAVFPAGLGSISGRRDENHPRRFFGAAFSVEAAAGDAVTGGAFAAATDGGPSPREPALAKAALGAVFPVGLGSISARRDENHPRLFFGAGFASELAAGDAAASGAFAAVTTGGTDGGASPREPALAETALGAVLPAGLGSISGRRDENHLRRCFGAAFSAEAAAGDVVSGGAFASIAAGAAIGDLPPRPLALAEGALGAGLLA
jgi:hypothetical protein